MCVCQSVSAVRASQLVLLFGRTFLSVSLSLLIWNVKLGRGYLRLVPRLVFQVPLSPHRL